MPDRDVTKCLSHVTMEAVDVSAEIVKEARAYRRADAALVKHRERLAELFRIARSEHNIGPADLARLVDHLYTPDHISRLTQPKKPAKD